MSINIVTAGGILVDGNHFSRNGYLNDQYFDFFAPPPISITSWGGDLDYIQNEIKKYEFSKSEHNSRSISNRLLDEPSLIDLKKFIIGFVHRYDLVNKQAEDKFNISMNSLIEPIHTVSDKDTVSKILYKFVKRRQQIFIVADEFGTTTGLITLEDAIETLLGVEIVDEHDNVVDMRKLASAKLEKRQQKEKVID